MRTYREKEYVHTAAWFDVAYTLSFTRSLAHFACLLAWTIFFFQAKQHHFDATANQLCDVRLLLFVISLSHVNTFFGKVILDEHLQSETHTPAEQKKNRANQRIYDTNRWENLKHACNQHKRINTGKYLNGIGKLIVTFLMGNLLFLESIGFLLFFRIENEMCFSFD